LNRNLLRERLSFEGDLVNFPLVSEGLKPLCEVGPEGELVEKIRPGLSCAPIRQLFRREVGKF
jgi:hypothetical protein